MKTTNYYNTFIEVAEDCPVSLAEVPAARGAEVTAAQLQYEMIITAPYTYTSDDVLFEVHAVKKGVSPTEKDVERLSFFSKGQACFRASPLTKRYGWGVHFDTDGKMAIYGLGSEEYKKLQSDPELKHLKGMRSKRA